MSPLLLPLLLRIELLGEESLVDQDGEGLGSFLLVDFFLNFRVKLQLFCSLWDKTPEAWPYSAKAALPLTDDFVFRTAKAPRFESCEKQRQFRSPSQIIQFE